MNAKKYKALRGQLRRTLRPIWEHYCRVYNRFLITREEITISEQLQAELTKAAALLGCTRIQAARMILHV